MDGPPLCQDYPGVSMRSPSRPVKPQPSRPEGSTSNVKVGPPIDPVKENGTEIGNKARKGIRSLSPAKRRDKPSQADALKGLSPVRGVKGDASVSSGPLRNKDPQQISKAAVHVKKDIKVTQEKRSKVQAVPQRKGALPQQEPGRDKVAKAKPVRAEEPPPPRWQRPGWDPTYNLEDRRPAGVFVLRRKDTRGVYWGTAWDLHAAMHEQLALTREGAHPDARFHGLGEGVVEFVVVREVPLPPWFKLQEVEDWLGRVRQHEAASYRSHYTHGLVVLYKHARTRVALRLWHGKARLQWLAEWGAAVVELQRWARGCMLRRRQRRKAIAEKRAQAQVAVAGWCQRLYRGQRDRARVAKALAFAAHRKPPGPIGKRLGEVAREGGDRDKVKYKIKRLQYLEKKKAYAPPPPPPPPLLLHPEALRPPPSQHKRPTPVSKKRPVGAGTRMGPSSALLPPLPSDDAEALRLHLRRTAMPAILTIQRVWRGVAARLYVGRIFYRLRGHRLMRTHAACTIRDWYRRCLAMRDDMNRLVDLRHERHCVGTIQRVYRGHVGRRIFHSRFDALKVRRRRGAIECQRLARGHLGRRFVHHMRTKLLRLRMAVTVARFFYRAKDRLAVIRRRIVERRDRAATRIQTVARMWLARRRVVEQRVFLRHEHAAQRIQLAYHRHTYRRRKRLRFVASLVGQCDACVGERAFMYLEATEQKLCRPCAITTMALINAKRLRQDGRTYDVASYRKATRASGVIQQAWRKSCKYKKRRFGECPFCRERPVRLYCPSCKYRACRACSAAVHSVSVLRRHVPMPIETLLRQKKAAALICAFFAQHREKMKLQHRFGNDTKARRAYGATLMQKLFRGHYTRLVYEQYCMVVYSLVSLLHTTRRPYLLLAAYPTTLDRAARFLNPQLQPSLTAFTPTLGLGPFSRAVRQRSARAIQGAYTWHVRYTEARGIVEGRRKVRDTALLDALMAREREVACRIAAAGVVQRVWRGHSGRSVWAARRHTRRVAMAVVRQATDVAALLRRAKATWQLHKGFLGQACVTDRQLWHALREGVGTLSLPLLPSPGAEGAARPMMCDMLVGGTLQLALSLRSSMEPPYSIVASRMALRRAHGSAAQAGVPTFCVHQSSAPLPLPLPLPPSSTPPSLSFSSDSSQPLSATSAGALLNLPPPPPPRAPLPALPSVLKVQLAGVGPCPPAAGPTSGYLCRVWLCGEALCSSTRSLPRKPEPSFHDEVLYVSLRRHGPSTLGGGSEDPTTPGALRLEVCEDGVGGRAIGHVALSAAELLGLLGHNARLPLTPPESGGGEGKGAMEWLSVTLSLEPASRTESRVAATSTVRHITRLMRAELDRRTPRIELRLLQAEVPDHAPITSSPKAPHGSHPHRPSAARRPWTAEGPRLDPEVHEELGVRVDWSADRSTMASAYVAFGHKLRWPTKPDEAPWTLGLPDGYPEEDWEVRVTLTANLSHPQTRSEDVLERAGAAGARDVVVGVGRLGARELYQPQPSSRWVDIFAPGHTEGSSSSRAVARVQFRVSSCFVPAPHWRRRLALAEHVVASVVRKACQLVPQPRLELRLHEASDVPSRVRAVTADVYWGQRHVARLHERRRAYPEVGQSTPGRREDSSAHATVSFERTRSCLFFPLRHEWGYDPPPSLRIVLRGSQRHTGDTYLGEARFDRNGVLLLPSTRASKLPLTEPFDTCDPPALHRLPGLLTATVTPHQLPPNAYANVRPPCPYLCLRFIDVRHEAATATTAGGYCRVFWRGAEVARTSPASGAARPTWADEVVMLQVRDESEHPLMNPTLPLLLQIYRPRVVNGRLVDELVGEAVPFNGVQRAVPSGYYPFDICAAGHGVRDGRVIGQLGLGLWMEYQDVDRHASRRLLSAEAPLELEDEGVEAGRTAKFDDKEVLDESKRLPTASDVHRMAVTTIRHDRARRYSHLSGLAKSEADALALYDKAREAAERNPSDRQLQQYVRLLKVEVERAGGALRSAKLQMDEARSREGQVPKVDLFLGITTKTTKQEAMPASAMGKTGRTTGAEGLSVTTKRVRRRPPAVTGVGAAKPGSPTPNNASVISGQTIGVTAATMAPPTSPKSSMADLATTRAERRERKERKVVMFGEAHSPAQSMANTSAVSFVDDSDESSIETVRPPHGSAPPPAEAQQTMGVATQRPALLTVTSSTSEFPLSASLLAGITAPPSVTIKVADDASQLTTTASSESSSSSTSPPPPPPLEFAQLLLSDRRLGPCVPVRQPSMYLKLERATGVSSGITSPASSMRTNPCVHVYWKGRRVATSQPAVPSGKKTGAYAWDETEAYLIPLSPFPGGPSGEPDGDLMLELWMGPEFAGQVLVEAAALEGECLRVDKVFGRKKRLEVPHTLMPREGDHVANTFGTLHMYLVRLDPELYTPLEADMVGFIDRALREEREGNPDVAQVVNLPPGTLRSEHDDATLRSFHLTYLARTYYKRRYIARLQVLGGSDLPRGWGMDETDPFLVLLLDGREVGRTIAMDNTMHPLFRGDAVFDLPFDCLQPLDVPEAEGQEPKTHVLTLQLYDANDLAKHELLGHVTLTPPDLRRMLGHIEPLTIQLEKPKKPQAGNKDKAAPPEPTAFLYLAMHLLPRPRQASRIELRITQLQLPPPEPAITVGKRRVQVDVTWNGVRAGSLEGSVASSGKTTLDQCVTDLPFVRSENDVPAVVLRQRRFSEIPATLRLEVYDQPTLDGPRRFLGQVTSAAPFGLSVNEEEVNLLGSQYEGTTYRVTPSPDMLLVRSMDKAQRAAMEAIGGRLTCVLVLCDPSDIALAWMQATRAQRERGPKTRLKLLDAMNFVDVPGLLPGTRVAASPHAAVYFNHRLVHTTSAVKDSGFPCWEGEEVCLPLDGHAQSRYNDQAVIELLHGAGPQPTLLGVVTLPAEKLYAEGKQGQRSDHRLTPPPFGRLKAAQGTLSLSLESLAPMPPPSADTQTLLSTSTSPFLGTGSSSLLLGTGALSTREVARTLKELQSRGHEPQRWVRLNIVRAKNLRKVGLLGKSDAFCLVLWNRHTQVRTPVVYKSSQPAWNLKYDLRYDDKDEQLGELELRVLVLHRDAVGGDRFLGQVVVTGTQLLSGSNGVIALPLQPRVDVPDDAGHADELRASQLWLSFERMEEPPFTQSLSAMHLMVASAYAALEVVTLDAPVDLEPPAASGSGSATTAATLPEGGKKEKQEPIPSPTFFVQLVYNRAIIARTACVPISRGEAQFSNELFVFPLSPAAPQIRSTSSSATSMLRSTSSVTTQPESPKTLTGTGTRTLRLQHYDFAESLRLEAFGVFPNTTEAPGLLGPTVRRLGHIDLRLQDFLEPPLFQARHVLSPEGSMLTTATGVLQLRQTNLETHYGRGKCGVSLRLACLRPPAPRIYTSPLMTPCVTARLRLRLYGIAFSEGVDGTTEGQGHRLRNGATYAVNISYGLAPDKKVDAKLPLLDFPTGPLAASLRQGKVGASEVVIQEYLLDLPPDAGLRDVTLTMTVTQNGGTVVGTEQSAGRLDPTTTTLGDVELTWHELSSLPLHHSICLLSELERKEAPAPTPAASTSAGDPTTSAASQAQQSVPDVQLFQSRLVYTQPHVSAALTEKGSHKGLVASAIRVSPFRLVYGMCLELPCVPTTSADTQDAADKEEEEGASMVLAKPHKHVTSQGFDVTRAQRLLHESEDPLLASSSAVAANRCAEQDQLRRRLRLNVSRVCMKRSAGPGSREVLRPLEATCLVTWEGKEASTLEVSSSGRQLRAEHESTCYIALPDLTQDGPGPELRTIIQSTRQTGAGGSVESDEGCGGGVVALSWSRLAQLPWNATNFFIRSGDEPLYDPCAYCTVTLEALRDTDGLDDVAPLPATNRGGTVTPRVRVLSPLVVTLRLCLETSRTRRPLLLELFPLRAEGLADCEEWGTSRIPYLRQRQVYAVVKRDALVWHTTNPSLAKASGCVDTAGPAAIVPLPQAAFKPTSLTEGGAKAGQAGSGFELALSMHDLGHYSGREELLVIRLQQAARAWVARRRVALLRAQRKRRRRRWYAATTIFSAARRWLQLRQRNRATLLLQRVGRGHNARRRMEGRVISSELTFSLHDLCYETVEDGAAPCLVTCAVSWNGRILKRLDVTVTPGGCTATHESVACTLRRALQEEGAALYHVHEGAEYYVVDPGAQLTLVLAARRPANMPSGALNSSAEDVEWLSASIVLHAHELSRLCQAHGLSEPATRKTCLRADFSVVGGDTPDGTARGMVDQTMQDRGATTRGPTSSSVYVGVSAQSLRPLWDPASSEPDVATKSPAESAVASVLEATLHKVVTVAQSRPLTVRILGFHDLAASAATSAPLLCLVTWEGRRVATLELTFDPAITSWTPTAFRRLGAQPADQGDSAAAFTVTLSADDKGAFISLSPPGCTNPEVSVTVVQEGLHGRLMLASTRLEVSDLLDLRRKGVRQRAGGESSVVEVVMDIMDDRRRMKMGGKGDDEGRTGQGGGSMPILEVGVYYTITERQAALAATATGRDGRRRSSTPTVYLQAAQHATSDPLSAAPIAEGGTVRGEAASADQRTSQSDSVPQPSSATAELSMSGGVGVSRPVAQRRPSRRSSTTEEREAEGKEGKRLELPHKLELDGERQLYYYVNEQGERVYQIPVKAMQPHDPST